jgi:hypothetical protein
VEGKIVSSYVRVLAESEQNTPLSELRTVLGTAFEVVAEGGDEPGWSALRLRQTEGPEIAVIRRDPVGEGKSGSEELAELASGMQNASPARAAEWLRHYFSHVKVVYTMEPLPGSKGPDGVSAMLRAQAYFWKRFGGILQADDEGFSNREGYHVLWQFRNPQQGELEAAVMDDNGEWIGFMMDMDDPEQVAAFQRGEVPARAVRR